MIVPRLSFQLMQHVDNTTSSLYQTQPCTAASLKVTAMAPCDVVCHYDES